MTQEPQRAAEIERLAREDHRKGCRDEPPFESISISHRYVHETAAMLLLNHRKAERTQAGES